MLETFRKLAGTWPARVLFFALAAAFVAWGVSGRMGAGGPTAGEVARINGQPITQAAFGQEFQQEWRQVSQRFPDPSQAPPGIRDQVAQQVLSRLLTQAALAEQARKLGLAAPDSAVREQVYAIPAFRGPSGQFDRATFLSALQNAGLSEARFLELVAKDVQQNQLLGTIAASLTPPGRFSTLLFGFVNEKRRADEAVIPITGPAPNPPSESVLERWYDNHPTQYAAPEYRRVRIVVLSPETIGRSLDIAETDLKTWFDQHRSEFESPEKRSLEVLTAASDAQAAALAAKWRAGASWDAIQQDAKQAGATAVSIDDATPAQIPSPELARAAFAASQGAVTGPVREPLGQQIFVVTRITPARTADYAALKPTIRDRVGAERAADLIDARAQKLQDSFAGGARMDEIPADLGAAGVQGTLDAQGKTPEGNPAPIPGTQALRQAIIDAAFHANKGDPIALTEGPDRGWYAVQVEDIIKPAKKPFGEVRAQVLADWQHDQIRHTAEQTAAKILALVKSGQSLQSAVWGTGVAIRHPDPVTRNRPSPDVPAELAAVLFTLKPGEGTMIETGQSFIVATLAQIIPADPQADASGLASLTKQVDRIYAEMTAQTYSAAVLRQARVSVNQKALQDITQQ